MNKYKVTFCNKEDMKWSIVIKANTMQEAIKIAQELAPEGYDILGIEPVEDTTW